MAKLIMSQLTQQPLTGTPLINLEPDSIGHVLVTVPIECEAESEEVLFRSNKAKERSKMIVDTIMQRLQDSPRYAGDILGWGEINIRELSGSLWLSWVFWCYAT